MTGEEACSESYRDERPSQGRPDGQPFSLDATLVAEHAGETISEITLAMTQRIGLGALAHVIHPYPTQAEVIRKAADSWRRGKLTPPVQRLFGAWFRLRRLAA